MGLLALSFLLLLVHLCSSDSPFTDSLASRFSLHTAYRNVYRQILALQKGCQPLAVFAVLRSGTSVPDRATIDKITQLLLRLRYSSAPATQALLRSWTSSFHLEDSNRLTPEGKREADHIGARLHQLLAPLRLNANSSEFAVEAGTSAVRLKDAAVAFAKRFDTGPEAVRSFPQEGRPLYDSCGRVPTIDVGTGEDEVRKFKNGRELSNRLKKFNERHQPKTPFSLDDFLTTFKICAYDTAVDEKARSSPWCKLFTTEDIYAIEYLQDLKQFWRGSYGRPTNVLPACGIALKMMKMLKDSGKSSKKGLFLFTEADTFLSLLSLLRIIKTKGDLRSKDFNYYAASRLFRSSKFVPFSANLVLVLQRCQGSTEPFLLPILNENRRSWANCSDSCPLKTIESFLSPCAPRGDALCLVTRNTAHYLHASTSQLFGFASVAMMTLLRV